MKEQELSVLAYLIRKPELFYQFGSQIDDLHFEYHQARILFNLLKSIFYRHKQMPSKEEFLWRVQSHNQLRELPLLQRMSIELRAREIYEIQVSETTGDYIASFVMSREATRMQDLIEKLREPGHIDNAEKHLKDVYDMTEKMTRLVRRDKREGLSLPFEDEALANIKDYVLEGYGGEPIAFGLPQLDYRTRGGAHGGEFQLFVGGTGVGKTVLGVSVSSSFLKRGYGVFYAALDNSEGDLRTRFLASITGIPVDLDIPLGKWAEQVQANSRSLRNQRLYLAIQHFPAQSVTLREIKIACKQQEEDFRRRAEARGEEFNGFDLKVVDYIDMLLPEIREKEKRHNLQQIVQGCTGWAQETKGRVLGLSQTNVGGLNSEIVTLENMAEAYSKSWPAALVGCLCQTEAEYLEGAMRLAVPKNRNGPKNFMISLDVNYRNYRIQERSEEQAVSYAGEPRTKGSSNGGGKRKNPTVRDDRDYNHPG